MFASSFKNRFTVSNACALKTARQEVNQIERLLVIQVVELAIKRALYGIYEFWNPVHYRKINLFLVNTYCKVRNTRNVAIQKQQFKKKHKCRQFHFVTHL
jgi:hypothetical protein